MGPDTGKSIGRTKSAMSSATSLLGLGGLVVVTATPAIFNFFLRFIERDERRAYRWSGFLLILLYFNMLSNTKDPGLAMIYGVSMIWFARALLGVLVTYQGAINLGIPDLYRGYQQAWFLGTFCSAILLGIIWGLFEYFSSGGFALFHDRYGIIMYAILASLMARASFNGVLEKKIKLYTIQSNMASEDSYYEDLAIKMEKNIHNAISKGTKETHVFLWVLAVAVLLIQAYRSGLIFG